MAARRKKEEGSPIESALIASAYRYGDRLVHAITHKKATFVQSEREGWNTVKTSSGVVYWTDACTLRDEEAVAK